MSEISAAAIEEISDSRRASSTTSLVSSSGRSLHGVCFNSPANGIRKKTAPSAANATKMVGGRVRTDRPRPLAELMETRIRPRS